MELPAGVSGGLCVLARQLGLGGIFHRYRPGFSSLYAGFRWTLLTTARNEVCVRPRSCFMWPSRSDGPGYLCQEPGFQGEEPVLSSPGRAAAPGNFWEGRCGCFDEIEATLNAGQRLSSDRLSPLLEVRWGGLASRLCLSSLIAGVGFYSSAKVCTRVACVRRGK